MITYTQYTLGNQTYTDNVPARFRWSRTYCTFPVVCPKLPPGVPVHVPPPRAEFRPPYEGLFLRVDFKRKQLARLEWTKVNNCKQLQSERAIEPIFRCFRSIAQLVLKTFHDFARTPKFRRHLFEGRARRGGQKYLGYFGPFWAQKVPGSTQRYLEFLLTNTSINLGVMGISTLVLHSAYVYQ